MSSSPESHESFDAATPDASVDLGHESEATPSLTTQTNKRRRLNSSNSDVRRSASHELSDMISTPQPPRSLTDGPSSEPMKHKPGQIVRLEMHNFTTYTKAVLYPGPSLNMVIGPNGTGKSTIVCAICLGLNYPPHTMGRAKEASEYVKTGHNEAKIVIELQGHKGQDNRVVECRIVRAGNQTSFTIDGRKVPKFKVSDLANEFNIQVDNLCNFLPQDRVVEFSGLSHVDRLRETLRAVAPAEIQNDYAELKKMREEQRKRANKQTGMENNVADLRRKQDRDRVDVERMRNRREWQDKKEKLERLRPLAASNDAKKAAREAKILVKDLAAEVRRLKAIHQPLLEVETRKKVYLANVTEVRKKRESEVKSTERALKMHEQKRGKIESDIKGKQAAKKHLKREDNTRRDNIANYERVLQKLREELERGEPDIDIASLLSQIRDMDRQIDGLTRELREIEDRRVERNAQIKHTKNRLTGVTGFIEQLQSAEGQRKSTLKRLSPDAARAWDIVQQNRHIFDKPVYGPALIECTPTDERFIPALELVIQRSDLFAITASSQEDFKRLDHLINSQHKLRNVTLRTAALPLDSPEFRRHVRDEEVQALGIDRWALDLLKGPEPVLAMLAENARLHLQPAFSQKPRDDIFDRLLASGLPGFITPQEILKITRRRDIAQAAASTSSRNVTNQARLWSKQAVDNDALGEAKQSMRELQDALEELEKQAEQERQAKSAKEAELSRLEEEKEPIVQERDQQKSAKNRFDSLPSRIESNEEKLASEKRHAAEHDSRLKQADREEMKLIIDKGQNTLDLCNQTRQRQIYMVELLRAQLAEAEAESDAKRLEEENAESDQQVQAKEAEQHEAVGNLERLRARFERLSKRADECPAEVVEYYRSLPDEERNRSVEQLEADLTAVVAQLELLDGGNEGLIAEYEQRAREIDECQAKLDNFAHETQQLVERIQTTRGRFEPFVEQLTAQISATFAASFAKLNCTGAVELGQVVDGEGNRGARGDDFDLWELQIYVSFRGSSGLQLLDDRRQSGGERSVSTIFFLMALQSLSKAPFRIVDEINQGMDPRNERMVHGRLVGIACGEDVDGTGAEAGDSQVSQYFLITPKLLTGLYFGRGMKVHIINSGQNMPADPGALNLRKIISGYKSTTRAAAAAAAA